MCRHIKELCGNVYNREIDCQKLQDQILAQKTVYLLEAMGVYVGDYSFNWCKYGPYSIKLQDDILGISQLWIFCDLIHCWPYQEMFAYH